MLESQFIDTAQVLVTSVRLASVAVGLAARPEVVVPLLAALPVEVAHSHVVAGDERLALAGTLAERSGHILAVLGAAVGGRGPVAVRHRPHRCRTHPSPPDARCTPPPHGRACARTACSRSTSCSCSGPFGRSPICALLAARMDLVRCVRTTSEIPRSVGYL